MATTRRDFLRTSACALGSMAMASSIESFGIVNALTPQAATGYKALVCIFLNGGNDGNNVLVDLNQYATYATGRGVDIAIPQAQLLPVSPVGGGSYGFHPNMPEMQTLFNQGKLAVVCNNGPLVEPLTRTTYQNGTGKKPLQLFSHSDQVGLYSHGDCQHCRPNGLGWSSCRSNKIAERARYLPFECLYRGNQFDLDWNRHASARGCRFKHHSSQRTSAE